MHGPLPIDCFSALRPGPGAATDALEAALADRPETAAAVRLVLDECRRALHAVADGGCHLVPLAHLNEPEMELLGQVLGEGDVKAKIDRLDGGVTRVQESVMPGLWRVLCEDRSWLEIGQVPDTLDLAARTLPLGLDVPEDLPEGAMNVRPVLEELRHAARSVDAGGEGCEINLTLLPMTPVDMMMLDGSIGTGPIEVLSLGYGNCRITGAARRHLWSVRYYNTEDKLILNTVQASGIPVAARSTAEDMRDGADKLDQMMQGLFA